MLAIVIFASRCDAPRQRSAVGPIPMVQRPDLGPKDYCAGSTATAIDLAKVTSI
jgi:hypothetical protein